MKMSLKIVLFLAVTALLIPAVLGADVKFKSEKSLSVDAQNIRLKALDMGWTVNKPVSFIAAGIIMGKDWLYPRSEIEIFLRETNGQLQIRAQVSTKDAGTANWHDVHAEKNKKAPDFCKL